MHRIASVIVSLALIATACGSEGEATTDQLTIVASSPGALAVGEQRVLMVIADPEGTLAGSSTDPATASFRSADGTEYPDVATEWVWGIEDVRGFYVAEFDFDSAGMWEVSLTVEEGMAQPATFQVSEQAVVPEVGTPAPRSPSTTSSDAPIDEISTDPDPDPSFYELSIADAVANGRPTVIVFATPAFCQTAVCGPMLDLVKAVAPDHPNADFVHVEIYENIDDPQGQLVEVTAVTEWGLQTEPWVFVVDAGGTVSARFEGAMGAEELERALADVGA